MKPENIISTEPIFDGKLIRVELRQVRLDDGSQARREIVINRGAVVIVAMTRDYQVRLVRQYRAAIEDWVLELPAGVLEAGENPDEAAPRELQEETGDRAAHWTKLHGYYSAPGIFTEFLNLYLATDLTPGPSNLEEDEHIELLTVPFTEAIDLVRQHKIEDAKTVAGLLAAGLHLGLLGVQTPVS